jgi:2,5-diamino-6-(ribosylamino)-4(3H)-pyrimidinone 5'-phosphate reductase
MLPKVIVHNSISLDGSLTNFEPNMELHYLIAGGYKPQAHLIGSNTIKAGVELYGGIPLEEEEDFRRPERCRSLPYWVIPDTKGKLKGLLHTCRRFEFSRDVVVLISKTTPENYVEYLGERDYIYHVTGETQVDLEKSLELLSSKYGAKRVLCDTGRVLGNLLVEQNLVSELSLLVHPVIVGRQSYNIFGGLNKNPRLVLRRQEPYPGGCVWLVYRIDRKAQDL